MTNELFFAELNLSISTLFTFGLLGASILTLLLTHKTKNINENYGFLSVFLLAYLSSLYFGITGIEFLVVLLTAIGALFGKDSENKYIRWGSVTLILLISIALSLHAFGLTKNPIYLIHNAVQIGENSNIQLYANFDKGVAGILMLIAFWKPERHKLNFTAFSMISVITLMAVLSYALISGIGEFSPKAGIWLLAFAFSNLLFTCVAEEVFFRNVLQQPLSRVTSKIFAIIIMSLLFGAVHLAAGIQYAIGATIAGLGYALVFEKTGRLEFAIALHFLINLSTITFLSINL